MRQGYRNEARRGRWFLAVSLVVIAMVAEGLALGIGPVSAGEGAAPVLLLHGWLGTASGLDPLRSRFEADGFVARTVSFGSSQDNVANAATVADAVARLRAETGAPRVHIVAHSMGGLAARWYLARLRGTESVASLTMMGTPNYGIGLACLLPVALGGQMCPSSPFLRRLNAGDDTPGTLRYTTVSSRTGDDAQANRVDGGAWFVTVCCPAHQDEPSSPEMYAAVVAAVRGNPPGEFRSLPSD